MSILTVASGQSVYRGYEYSQSKKSYIWNSVEKALSKQLYPEVVATLMMWSSMKRIQESLNAPVLMLQENVLYVNTWLPCILLRILWKPRSTCPHSTDR